MTSDPGNPPGVVGPRAPDGIGIERGRMNDVERIASLWVDLAAGQRAYGSHLHADANRTAAIDAVAQAVVSRTIFVARDYSRGEQPDADTSQSDADNTAASSDIVGFVTFGRDSGRYEQDTTSGTVYNLYVHPAYRGDGLGTRLLAHAERTFADMGVETVGLEVMAENVDAQRFYERNGYTRHRIQMEKSVSEESKR